MTNERGWPGPPPVPQLWVLGGDFLHVNLCRSEPGGPGPAPSLAPQSETNCWLNLCQDFPPCAVERKTISLFTEQQEEANLLQEVIFKNLLHFSPQTSNDKNDTCLSQKVWKIQRSLMRRINVTCNLTKCSLFLR